MDARQHHLTRWVFLRLLALVHLVAFLSYWDQVHGLIGEQGIAPAVDSLENAARYFEREGRSRWWNLPTLAWWLGADDASLSLMCGAGAGFAVLLLLGVWPRVTLLGAWALYLSLFSLSSPFLGYQWDILLLEVSVVAILYAPRGLFPRPKTEAPPSKAAIWLLRLVLFKVMFSSGVVKLNSGDPSWRDLTAMTWHYWTQPLPHGVAWYAHNVPLWVHRWTAELTFHVELVAPFLVFANPRRWRLAVWLGTSALLMVAVDLHTSKWALVFLVLLAVLLDDRVLGKLWQGEPTTHRMGAFWLIAGLMAGISATGNYGFFQLLVWALCVTLLDDTLLRRILPARLQAVSEHAPSRRDRIGRPVVWVLAGALIALNGLQMLSLVGRNTLRDALRAAEEPSLEATTTQTVLAGLYEARVATVDQVRHLALVNGYGLFATMTKQRDELIVEGSRDGKTWKPYRFVYKPDDPRESPPVVGVHMPRLDWQMWFAALAPRCSPRGRVSWTLAFVQRLLDGSPSVRGLLAEVPFEEPPALVRIRRAPYTFTDGETREATGRVWAVGDPGPWCPALSLKNFERAAGGG